MLDPPDVCQIRIVVKDLDKTMDYFENAFY